MGLLDDDESWKLFCATTFGEDECPCNLVEIGKNIVKKCRGLPLSIVVTGGHLKKASRVEKEWEVVARNMISFLDSGEDQCLSILSLSYNHLPACLKPCFLYIPEDEKIDVPTLIRFWVAEGLLLPDGARSFEEIAESYLADLVDRNLILVQQKGLNGKILKCGVHDLVRELCLEVGRKGRFFFKMQTWEGSGGSRICMAEKHWQLDRSRLVELLTNNIGKKEVFGPRYMEELFDRHLELRYIYRELWSSGPSIYRLVFLRRYLQTLIIRIIGMRLLAPSEIWEMPWLRYVCISKSLHLPDLPKRHFVMHSLQTLKVVEKLTLSEDVCGRIPNIKDVPR